MQVLIIFAATFCVVFALGFQSQVVNHGHYKAAFLNSFLISLAQLAILKFVPQAHGFYDYAAYMTGGPLGIIASMWVHRQYFRKPAGYKELDSVVAKINEDAHLGI